jgi:hypothetical protein
MARRKKSKNDTYTEGQLDSLRKAAAKLVQGAAISPAEGFEQDPIIEPIPTIVEDGLTESERLVRQHQSLSKEIGKITVPIDRLEQEEKQLKERLPYLRGRKRADTEYRIQIILRDLKVYDSRLRALKNDQRSILSTMQKMTESSRSSAPRSSALADNVVAGVSPAMLIQQNGTERQMAKPQKALMRSEKVKPILKVKGWTQNKWAGKAGVDPSVVYDYLKGTSNPRPESRNALAEALGVSEHELPE